MQAHTQAFTHWHAGACVPTARYADIDAHTQHSSMDGTFVDKYNMYFDSSIYCKCDIRFKMPLDTAVLCASNMQ